MNFLQKRTDVRLSSSRDKRPVCVSSPANRFCSCVPARRRGLRCPVTPVTDSLPPSDELQLWDTTSTHARSSPVQRTRPLECFCLACDFQVKKKKKKASSFFFFLNPKRDFSSLAFAASEDESNTADVRNKVSVGLVSVPSLRVWILVKHFLRFLPELRQVNQVFHNCSGCTPNFTLGYRSRQQVRAGVTNIGPAAPGRSGASRLASRLRLKCNFIVLLFFCNHTYMDPKMAMS